MIFSAPALTWSASSESVARAWVSGMTSWTVMLMALCRIQCSLGDRPFLRQPPILRPTHGPLPRDRILRPRRRIRQLRRGFAAVAHLALGDDGAHPAARTVRRCAAVPAQHAQR